GRLRDGPALGRPASRDRADRARWRRRMKKGIYAGCFPEKMSLEDRFALAAEAGFDGFELRANEEVIASDEKLRALAELARRTVPICSLMAAGGRRRAVTAADPDERARATELLRQTIRAARALGTDAILVVPGAVTEEVSYAAVWERSQAA